MLRKNPHHTKQFKLDAVNYRNEHPDLTQADCAKSLGIGVSILARWEAQFRDNDGIPTIGSGCYESEEQREIARLKRQLRDAQDILDILKKPSAFWEKITDGFVYLNCIMDLYSRKIIAWTLADILEVSTMISTINKTKTSRVELEKSW